MITFEEMKQMIAQYAGRGGKCPTDPAVDLLARSVLQQLLHRGDGNNLKKWRFCAKDGCFVAPTDLEIPIGIRIDNETSRVWDRWYEFYDHSSSDSFDRTPGIFEEVGTVSTAHILPREGARVVAIPEAPEDSNILIKGLDANGNEIGFDGSGGEVLPIKKDKPEYSKNTFHQITGIIKEKTKSPVTLYWIQPEKRQRGHLATYRALDTKPYYKRFRINNNSCRPGKLYTVSILGRIRVLNAYHDTDIIPVSNIHAITQQAKMMQSLERGEIDNSREHSRATQAAIDNENRYGQTPSQPLNIVQFLSPGDTENLM